MAVTKELFGKTKDGKEVYAYTISNKNNMSICVINYGAILKNVFVPNKKGKIDDVVLGYDKLYMYFKNGSFFGATVGPMANRTENASFKIGSKTYTMPVNDNANNLHSDMELGFHKRLWDAVEGKNSVTFSLTKKDGEMGHPGTMKVQVTYTLTEKNEIKIHYHADTNKKTMINMTNHSYFNLSGIASDNMEHTSLQLNCSNYVPVRKDAIPLGGVESVKGTIFDFTKAKKISKDIEKKDNIQIKNVKGYDHNWCIDGWKGNGKLLLAAVATDAKSGRTMETYTDLPGIQFYAGNCIGSNIGKGGYKNMKRKGFCLETQYYPNSANVKDFPQPIFDSKNPYDTTTVYKFIW